MEEPIRVAYTLKSDDVDFSIELLFDRNDFSLKKTPSDNREWTRLSFHKCSHCPLSEEQFLHCPLASAIDDVIMQLHSVLSHDSIHATATFRNRTVSAEITVQEAVGSLFGLIIPTSGCPHTVFFRPLCRFHLPFANVEERVFRATSMFLLAQYFFNRKNGAIPFDLSRLDTIYGNVHKVNKYICRRLRDICQTDFSVNAIVILDMVTLAIHSAIKHDLKEFKPYFSAYVDNIVFPSTSPDEEVHEDAG